MTLLLSLLRLSFFLMIQLKLIYCNDNHEILLNVLKNNLTIDNIYRLGNYYLYYHKNCDNDIKQYDYLFFNDNYEKLYETFINQLNSWVNGMNMIDCKSRALLCYTIVLNMKRSMLLEYNRHDILQSFDYTGMLNDLGILYGSIDLYDHAVDAYEEALKINPKLISALANLAGIIHTAVGNISYAEELYLQSINVANPNANPLYGYGSLYHNYGVFLRDIGRSKESISYFEKSLDIDKNLFQSFYNIAECECRKGSPTNINKAQSLYEKAMNIIELSDDNDSYWSVNIVKKTSVVPYLSEKIDTILSNRHEYINNINEMISKMITAKLNMSNDYDFVSKPINYIGCASLGYYIIYHGYEDLYVRQLLGMLYFVSSKNLLQFTSPYLISLSESINYISKVNQLMDTNNSNDQNIFLHGYFDSPTGCIHVAFLSSFWYRHSVGMLMKGVIKNLDRTLYCVTLIYVDYINKIDHITEELTDSLSRNVNDKVVKLRGSLKSIRLEISSLKIDVLVYGEIGMHELTYFLSFGRLAKRSIVFWGHATTSGLTGINDIRISRVLGKYSDSIDYNEDWIGPDYFLSSVLFEKNGPTLAQLEYSERLILMDGMTTYFEKPSPPLTYKEVGLSLDSDSTLNPFHLASKREFLVHLSSDLDDTLPKTFTLFGVPQTLYKMRADFDDMLKEILQANPEFYLVMPQGNDVDMYVYLKNRLRTRLGRIADRVIFVRSLSEREFLTLIGVIDVVLDPFPVGGGRSSLEIFSVGTPIISLISETSILQLTSAMYTTMKNNSNSPIDFNECCISYKKTEYIEKAIRIGSNCSYRSAIKEFILNNNYKLYNNYQVIEEWNKLLACIHLLPRPVPKQLKYNDIESFRSIDDATDGFLFKSTNWLKDEIKETRFSYNEPAILLHKIAIDKVSMNEIHIRIPDTYYSNNKNEEKKSVYSSTFSYIDYNHNDHTITLDIYSDNDWKMQCLNQLKEVASAVSPIMMLRMCIIAGTAVMRHKQYQYDIVPIEYSNGVVLSVLIKDGDDVGSILRNLYVDFIEYYTKNSNAVDDNILHEMVEIAGDYLTKTKLPADIMGSDKWVRYRSNIGRNFIRWVQSSDRLNATSVTSVSDSIHGLDVLSSSCGSYENQQFEGEETITLAISTSRRLKHFLQTIKALESSLGKLPNSLVTRVILVDDKSSEEDRDIMKDMYPSYEFYFKLPEEKGHANSMNKIFNLVDTHYLLYLEDDWRIFDIPILVDSLQSAVLAINNSTGNSNHIHPFQSILLASIAILKQDAIQQILFNSQSTRDCASGLNCDLYTMKSGGWERSAFIGNNTIIPYSLHEFGIASSLPDSHKLVRYGDRTHDFALWPGLTLNPGLWNIAKIKHMLSSCLVDQHKNLFDENDKLFEQRFSSLGYAAGITIGYFQSLLFEHIGGDVSAYNKNERPW